MQKFSYQFKFTLDYFHPSGTKNHFLIFARFLFSFLCYFTLDFLLFWHMFKKRATPDYAIWPPKQEEGEFALLGMCHLWRHFNFFTVIHSSQGPQKVTILLSVGIPGSQEKPFQEQLLAPLVLEEDWPQTLVHLLAEPELGVSAGSSGEWGELEFQGEWSTWMARLLPSGELQAHAELIPPDTLLIHREAIWVRDRSH